jgi:dephospho-CoA kinase
MIVGFVGFINSGKNSAAQYLTQKYSFKEESYANSLKNALVSIFGWDRELIEGKTEESRIWREKIGRAHV